MTLIVSVVSDDCIWQACDCRLTDVKTGSPVSVNTIKAVSFADSILVGYTGPAELEKKDTAHWIADVLCEGRDPNAAIDSFADRLGTAVQGVPKVARPMIVAFVGWGTSSPGGEVVPYLRKVSNVLVDGDRIGPLDSEFAAWELNWERSRLPHFETSGQIVPRRLLDYWMRQVSRRLEIGGPPREVGRCLVELIREVANVNPLVGRGVLISAIPKNVVSAPTGIILSSMPTFEQPTFLYFPEDSSESIQRGPEVAKPGGTRFSDFQAWTDEEGTETAQVTLTLP